MSGAGRKSHYRKSVTEEFLNSYPEPEVGDVVVKIVQSRGTNIFEIESPDGEKSLAMLPNKFKKLIWVKRNDYCIVDGGLPDKVEASTSSTADAKVKYLIKHPLNKDQIKHIQKVDKWPAEFTIDEVSKGRPGRAAERSIDDMYNGDEEEEEEEVEVKVDKMGNTIYSDDDDSDTGI